MVSEDVYVSDAVGSSCNGVVKVSACSEGDEAEARASVRGTF